MGFLTVFGITLGVLFLVAFFTKRRLAVLGPALAVGAMLSELWVGDLTPLVAQAGFVTVKPPLESVVAATLVLVPAFFLLLSGPAYHGKAGRVIGALLFALLANFLLLDVYSAAVIIDGPGRLLFDGLSDWKILGVSAVLLLAIFEGLGIKTPKPDKLAKH